MPYVEQTQYPCNRCEAPTLHTRLVEPFNHVIHILIFFFCCCWWLPFWLILAFSHNSRRDPWRCSNCGQLAGALTGEQQHALVVQRAEAAAQKAHYDAGARAAKAEHRAETRERRKDQFAGITDSVVAQLKQLPRQIDGALRIIAGKDNDIIFQFLRIASVVVSIGIGLGMLYFVFSVVASLF